MYLIYLHSFCSLVHPGSFKVMTVGLMPRKWLFRFFFFFFNAVTSLQKKLKKSNSNLTNSDAHLNLLGLILIMYILDWKWNFSWKSLAWRLFFQNTLGLKLCLEGGLKKKKTFQGQIQILNLPLYLNHEHDFWSIPSSESDSFCLHVLFL